MLFLDVSLLWSMSLWSAWCHYFTCVPWATFSLLLTSVNCIDLLLLTLCQSCCLPSPVFVWSIVPDIFQQKKIKTVPCVTTWSLTSVSLPKMWPLCRCSKANMVSLTCSPVPLCCCQILLSLQYPVCAPCIIFLICIHYVELMDAVMGLELIS